MIVALSPADAVDVASVARRLPDPGSLESGTRVEIPAEVEVPKTMKSRLLAALGRGATVPRVLRCTALVARGYVRVAADSAQRDTSDKSGKRDLVWGYAP